MWESDIVAATERGMARMKTVAQLMKEYGLDPTLFLDPIIVERND